MLEKWIISVKTKEQDLMELQQILFFPCKIIQQEEAFYYMEEARIVPLSPSKARGRTGKCSAQLTQIHLHRPVQEWMSR